MGQLGNLTNPGLVDPNTGGVHWYGNAPDALKAWAGGQRNFQPDTTSLDESGNPNPAQTNNSTPAPSLVKPSPQQAATLGGPIPNAESPALTKAGKLMTLLSSGLQGALAGRAANEQATVASGGRRSGGAGMGFDAGYNLPWQRAGMQNQLEQQQAQTGILRSEGQIVNVPGVGPMPGWLAKTLGPAGIRAQSALGVQGMKGQTAEDIQGQKSQTAQNVQGQKSGTALDVARINQGMSIPVDASTARLAGYPDLAGQSVGKGTWGNINKALEAKGYHTQDMGKNGTDENSGMWLMDKAGERISQISPNSLTFQRGASFAQNRPEQVVADPNNPGVVTYTSAANAMNNNMQSPLSAGTQEAKAEARSEVPTRIGDQQVNFSTAIAHADLLRNAIKGLRNGDVQFLNGLKNDFKNAFGYEGPITAQAIADAYGGEVTNVIAKGHITDKEMGKTSKTIDPNKQNFATMDSVLSAYQQLMKSKLDNLNKKAKEARSGGTTAPTNNDPLGIR